MPKLYIWDKVPYVSDSYHHSGGAHVGHNYGHEGRCR